MGSAMRALMAGMMVMLVGTTSPVQAADKGAPEPPAKDNPIVAEVNHQPIRLDDLRGYVSKNPLLRGYLGSLNGVRLVLDDMINAHLLALEGQAKGIALNDGEHPTDTSYVLRVRGRLTKPCSKPTLAEAKAYYKKHPEEFTTPEYARISRVYLPQDQKVSGQSARQFLYDEAKAIHEGKSDFGALVKKVKPLLPASAHIGDMGFLALQEDNELIRAIRKASVGSLIGPIDSHGLVYLFQVEARHKPELMTWDKVKDEAPKIAWQSCRHKSFMALRDKMVKKFPVVINEDVLNHLKLF